jgi:hypothetical protein
MWRIRMSIIGAIVFVIALAGLPLNNMKDVTAAPALQIITPTNTSVPTNTPIPIPTDTPLPPTIAPIATDTPQPIGTSIAPTASAGTSTPIPPAPKPRRGGGGAPPGPSGTPTVNGCVKSIGRDGISLSTEPGFYQPHVQIIPREHLAQVLAGPERADNIWWWQLQAETGAVGWGNQDDMTPDPGPCASGGSVLPGAQTPPYPVTILPASAFGQTPVVVQAPVQAVPLAQPTLQATPAQQEALPQTGDSLEGWWLTGLLAVIVIVVGFVRRRLQTQPAVDSRSDEETEVKK